MDNSKRIAYAPSFGYKIVPEEKKMKIKVLLNRFDKLSAREISGCKIIKELIGKEVPDVLDPVFLLSAYNYKLLTNPVELSNREFIFCYSLVGIKKQILLAKRLKEITGLPIVLVTSSVRLPIRGVDKIIRNAGPKEFIWLIDNASYVVTDSFHGTAFSLVFRKNFFSTIAYPAKAERIFSLLSEIGLSDRIFDKPEQITSDVLVINYELANLKIQEKLAISKAYLQEALQC